MTIETKLWDAAEYLETPEDVAGYLTAALEDGDPRVIGAALGDIARSRGMDAVARAAGVSRETLCGAAGEGGAPSLASILSLTRVLGLTLTARPADRADAA